MKRKQIRKLMLAKETVQKLGAAKLSVAAGGTGGSSLCETFYCETSNGPYMCYHAC
jgi:hypothetical protein